MAAERAISPSRGDRLTSLERAASRMALPAVRRLPRDDAIRRTAIGIVTRTRGHLGERRTLARSAALLHMASQDPSRTTRGRTMSHFPLACNIPIAIPCALGRRVVDGRHEVGGSEKDALAAKFAS